jgi:hypothetical protein
MVFLDILFILLHTSIIIFNLTGWIWKKTRKAHLIVVCLTFASWFLIGLWKGLGYCFLTDWHWQVKEKLGERALPNSFIKYAADKITGSDIDAGIIDVVTLIMFVLVLGITVYVNFFKKEKLNRQ